MKNFLVLFNIFILASTAFAQKGIIRGTVTELPRNEPVPYATVVIQGTSTGATTDDNGKYQIENLEPGLYNIVVNYVGYGPASQEVEVSNARPAVINFSLTPSTQELNEVEVIANGFYKSDESPVSVQRIGVTEVKRAPGANRDISRVLQSLPGVASTASFRNDILIRGGAPNENRFYLDGIEIPNINHFATQGASGGPVGMINVDFIENVEFFSGAYPAGRGNALSSVMEFTQKDGRTDQHTTNIILGTSDIGVTFEGPVTEKSSIIVSARQSYLQALFSVLGLPFLPTYNDFQLKYKYEIDQRNKISIIGLGAIDQFKLADSPGEPTDEDYEENLYILNNTPEQNQWNYTIGAKYEHFRDNSTFTFVASRNMLTNNQFKYPNNDRSQSKIYDYNSTEAENKFRLEGLTFTNTGFTFSYGVSYEYANYTNQTYQTLYDYSTGELETINFNSVLPLNKWGGFATVSKKLAQDKVTLSLGARVDANDYSDSMNNLLDQFSPRFSASYQFTPRWSLNFNTGIYYQLPTYTTLGYKEGEDFVNKDNGLLYIRNKQLVGGFEYKIPEKNLKFTIEGFQKLYDQYPYSINNEISLANLGADFGVIGSEAVTSTSKGRSIGIEFMAQQKFFKGFYGILAYTYVQSEFTNADPNVYAPSSWDSRNIVSLTGGKKLKRNWEIGARWLYSGGTPYTPYDVDASMDKQVWDAERRGVKDYSQVNTLRLSANHQLDVRVDKYYYFDKWSLNVYFDIQNMYGYQSKGQPILTTEVDQNGNPVTDPNDPSKYSPKYIETTNGIVQPSIGIIVEL
ncbi:TonB-dependent receptor [Flammeovirga agarivorans]|uniref:TonB-dependent receptor n=1 Tax=Flammeovirga agarivorans TaxID=2726742 RepID=A0A7X8SQ21_9BACT|nr:TonB-dependent receptor [Flammeovirga agarivorans]NLR94240.1 TonB-dependent receptor [Flammeovirga agarivorans]